MTIPALRASSIVIRSRPGAEVHRLAAFAVAWIVALVMVGVIVAAPPRLADAQVYWSAWHGPLYAGGFVYPPPGALLVAPAALLSWPAFAVAWLAVLAAAVAWLLWPLSPSLRLPLGIALAATLAWGNAATLLAVPLALAPRWPALWTLLAWTKVTPAVGAVVLVRQRRWRAVAVLIALSAVIGLAMLLLAPGLGEAWLAQLARNSGIPSVFGVPVPLPVRVAMAAGIAWLGASRPWTLAVAATVATPDLTLATLGILAAVPRLRTASRPGC